MKEKEENVKQKEFINSALTKLKDNLTKFIVDTNYSNIQSLYLRQQIDTYEKEILKQNPSRKNLSVNYKSLNNETILPLLISNKNPNKLYDKNKIYNTKKSYNIRANENMKRSEKNIFISPLAVRDALSSELRKFKNKEYLKYSNEYRNQRYYHQKILDKNNNCLIKKEDMDKGIYDMICKKLIPKTADITPAMDLGGNPLSITKKSSMGRNVNKLFSKEDIVTGDMNKLKFSQYKMDEIYNDKKGILPALNRDWSIRPKRVIPYYHETISDTGVPNLEKINNETDNKNNVFITRSDQILNTVQENLEDNNFSNIIDMKNKNNSSIKYNNSNTTKCNTINDNSSSINNINSSKIDSNIIKTFYDHILDIDMTNNILNNMENLFQKLNILNAKVDSNKILALIKYYNNNIKNIINKDLLECLTNEDIEEKGFDPKNERQLLQSIKEAFIIRIQKMIRRKLAYNRYTFLKIMNINVIYLQSHYRRYIVEKKMKELIEEKRNQMHEEFMKIFNDFKAQWEKIQDSSRIEIHINSISYDSYTNCLIDKYTMKESLQLNRLIRLVDPNIEIIYILPFHISDDILNYNFAILENMGIKDIENRLHLIVPEATEYIPSNYSLSKLLYLSPNTIKEIKEIIKNKNKKAYIVPGIVSPLEETISYLLETPIFMGNKEQIDLIFNKSGLKSAFELNDIAFPISAWDLKTEEEFYSSLAHLIVSYPAIQVWVFKTNLDSYGKGIAYLNISKIEIIEDFKYEKKTNPDFTDLIYQEKLYYELKNILIKNAQYCYPNLYSNWNEYMQKFLDEKGLIECCPTRDLDGIMSNPCLPIFIEPSGNIRILPSFEKINVDFFKNVACTSPQSMINNGELNKIGEKIGNFLYSQEIIGYVTLEFITFHDGKQTLYWGIDMKYGLTQIICDLQYCYILYIQI